MTAEEMNRAAPSVPQVFGAKHHKPAHGGYPDLPRPTWEDRIFGRVVPDTAKARKDVADYWEHLMGPRN